MNQTPSDSQYAAALAFLWGRIDYERTPPPAGDAGFRLERMRQLLARLGHPERSPRIVHVTGTKGKGSTSAMISAILRAAGLRTGLYTSPHLECVEERIAIDGQRCSPAEFAQLIDQLREPVAAMDQQTGSSGGPTFFEIITAAGFLHFAQQNCDAAVLEVGLGGRLDSTNVCQPSVSVITTISYDHTRQLGNTLSAIAREKAGIIKPGVPVVTGVVEPEPWNVIAGVAAEQQSPLFSLQREFGFRYRRLPPSDSVDSPEEARLGGRRLDYFEPLESAAPALAGLPLAMPGEHQALNAAVAICTMRRLIAAGWEIPESAIRTGLAEAICPARVEILQRHPALVVDAAHNVASIAALIRTLEEEFPGRPRIMVFASSRDKDVRGMLRLLLPSCERLILTQYQANPRCLPIEELHRLALEELAATGSGDPPSGSATRCAELQVASTPAVAWELARGGCEANHVVCAAGSFFLVAELPLQRGKVNL